MRVQLGRLTDGVHRPVLGGTKMEMNIEGRGRRPNDKRLQHFVPRSYLRAFANEAGQLAAILREPFEVRSVHVNTVAVESHFYKIRRADGTASDDLEDALAKFDGKIPGILERATSSAPLTAADVQDMRELYANLAVRSHLGRDLLVDQVRAARERIESEYEAKFPGDEAERRDRVLDGVIRSVFDHPDKYATDPETVSRLAIIGRAQDLLKTMPRYACVFESTDLEFIASDAPFAALDPASPPGPVESYGPKFSAPHIELTLPLGRHHAVLFSNVPIRESRAHQCVWRRCHKRSDRILRQADDRCAP